MKLHEYSFEVTDSLTEDAEPEGSQAQNSSQNFLFTHVIPKEEQWINSALLGTQTVLKNKNININISIQKQIKVVTPYIH
jgi:hypothetical protein